MTFDTVNDDAETRSADRNHRWMRDMCPDHLDYTECVTMMPNDDFLVNMMRPQAKEGTDGRSQNFTPLSVDKKVTLPPPSLTGGS